MGRGTSGVAASHQRRSNPDQLDNVAPVATFVIPGHAGLGR
jgi:hypothetical protein